MVQEVASTDAFKVELRSISLLCAPYEPEWVSLTARLMATKALITQIQLQLTWWRQECQIQIHLKACAKIPASNLCGSKTNIVQAAIPVQLTRTAVACNPKPLNAGVADNSRP